MKSVVDTNLPAGSATSIITARQIFVTVIAPWKAEIQTLKNKQKKACLKVLTVFGRAVASPQGVQPHSLAPNSANR